MTEEEISQLSFKKLQLLAKKHDMRANQKKSKLIEELVSLLQEESNEEVVVEPEEKEVEETDTFSDEFEEMKYVELRKLCTQNGLDSKGKKVELIERLSIWKGSSEEVEEEESDEIEIHVSSPIQEDKADNVEESETDIEEDDEEEETEDKKEKDKKKIEEEEDNMMDEELLSQIVMLRDLVESVEYLKFVYVTIPNQEERSLRVKCTLTNHFMPPNLTQVFVIFFKFSSILLIYILKNR